MSNLPVLPGAIYDTYGAATIHSDGTPIATAGSYTEIIASATRCYDAIMVTFVLVSGQSGDTVVTVGMGGAGSEQPIAQLKTSSTQSGMGYGGAYNYLLPVTVPAGNRIAIKYTSSGGFVSMGAIIMGIAGGLLADHGCAYGELFGVTGANLPNGTVVDPGSGSNTLGAWTEIVASTAHNYSYLTLVVGGNANADTQAATWLVDIAIGASGSEQIFIQQLCFTNDVFLGIPVPSVVGPFAVSIPAGTRIAMRCQSPDNGAPSRKIDVGLIGFVR